MLKRQSITQQEFELAITKTNDEIIHNKFKKMDTVLFDGKSPKDYFGINDFYKVYAYACHYLAMSKQVKDISADELTITFVSFRYPYKMIKHLEKLRGLEISKVDEGIYYILGDSFPMQLIVTKMLSKDLPKLFKKVLIMYLHIQIKK